MAKIWAKLLLILVACLIYSTMTLGANEDSIKLDELRNQAIAGNVEAQLELGREFFFGINRSKNLNLSFYYFNLAAKNGSVEGKFNVGICYEFGYGVEKSKIIAFNYYNESTTLDEAKFKVALTLHDGLRGEKVGPTYYKSIAKDYAASQKVINELIKNEYAPAMVWKAEELLGSKELNDDSLDYIFLLLSKADKKGDLRAKELLIDCYLKGVGTKINEEIAFNLATNLYKQGYLKIASKLALFYEFGIGVAPDMIEALKYYEIGSKLNDSYSRIKMADNYLSGFYLPTDMKKAISIYQEELNKGNSLALLRLANCYANGTGLERNDFMAFNYYLEAAARGEIEAQYKLAQFFREGRGTRVDETAVFFWLKQGAMHRNVDCMREVAECYIKGYGIEKDLDLAKELLLEAIKKGDLKSKQLFYEVF